MKRIISIGLTGFLVSKSLFAIAPVTLSTPSPAIPSNTQVGAKLTFTYKIKNFLPQWLPLSIGGITSPIQRIMVANDCGYGLLAGSPGNPSTCQIGISISPTTVQSVNQNLLVDYGGRLPLSSPIVTTVMNSQHYIFVTVNSYNGNLGGVSGADSLCQAEAYQLGSVLPQGLNFKALLVDSTRFPCDSTGSCGGAHALDWPLFSGEQFLNPDKSNFNQVNSNFVFDGSVISLMNPMGITDNSSSFWSGVQSVLSNAAANDIVAWAFDDVNPSQDGAQYLANLATCNNWSSSSSSESGSLGQLGQVNFVNGTVPGSTWGNYYEFNNSATGYLYNVWVYSDTLFCNAGSKLVCVSD